MKLILLLLFLILITPACENGVVISYNPEELDTVTFIKSEKLVSSTSEDLNCDYGKDTHKHKYQNSYYIYFTMTGDLFSPIISKTGKFKKIFDDFNIDFIKDGTEDKKVITTEDMDLKFISLRNNESKNPNLAFLLDITKYNECLADDSNIAECSLSGSGFNYSGDKTDFLGTIESFLSNGYYHFQSYDKADSYSEYPAKFFGALYMAFTANMPLNGYGSTGYYHFGSGYRNFYTQNGNKQYDPLKVLGEKGYRDLKASSHRKLWDNYIMATDILKTKSSKTDNQNLVLFLRGYEEATFDTDDKLVGQFATLKSEASEEDFINALDNATKQTPVFIGACRDNQKCNFESKDSFNTDNDNALYKIACKTGGAYFPEFYSKSAEKWKKASRNTEDYKKFLNKLEYSVYGMWRIKVQLDDSVDEDYTGVLKFTVGDKSIEVDYKIVR